MQQPSALTVSEPPQSKLSRLRKTTIKSSDSAAVNAPQASLSGSLQERNKRDGQEQGIGRSSLRRASRKSIFQRLHNTTNNTPRASTYQSEDYEDKKREEESALKRSSQPLPSAYRKRSSLTGRERSRSLQLLRGDALIARKSEMLEQLALSTTEKREEKKSLLMDLPTCALAYTVFLFFKVIIRM